MRMVFTFLFLLALIVDPYECSSHPAESPRRAHNPVRARSTSPAGSDAPLTVLGYPLKELGYMRLISRTNLTLQFEFRRYCFPVGKPLRYRIDKNRMAPIPTEERIVLSLSNGDVFAILDYTGFLTAIYRADRSHPRAKLNMISGEVEDLTPDEIRDCPAGKKQPIFPRNFIKAFSQDDTLQSVWNYHTEPQESALRRSKERYFPSRPLSDRVLGCSVERLGYFRLIPSTNHNQRFEFRRYIFPTDNKIRIRIDFLSYFTIPNQEYLVLSTSEGDVFAMMDYNDILRGIYQKNINNSRVKMNMMSGKVDILTPDEIRECPVGKKNLIFPNNFIKSFENYDSLRIIWNSDGRGNPSSSNPARQHSPDQTTPQEPPLRARSRSPPGKPPSDEVLGYPLAKLGYIRLIPQANPNQRFEFRRYVISSDRPIRLLLGKGVYVPVPAKEHIVLSTSKDEIFAILEYTGILRGLYATNAIHPRVKISMISGTVKLMTEIEKEECHVGKSYPVFPRWFRPVNSDEDSLQRVYQ